MTRCEKCGKEHPVDQVRRRTFWPSRTPEPDEETGQITGTMPKWIKTQAELCEDCYKGMIKALEGII